MDRAGVVEQRLNDAPGVFHAVLPGKAGGIALQRVTEETLVGFLTGTQRPLKVHIEFYRVADQTLAGLFGLHALADPIVAAQVKTQKFGCGWQSSGENSRRGAAACSSTTTSSAVVAKALPGSEVQRNPGPAPRVDFQAQGGEGLHRGTGGHFGLVEVALYWRH
jgi:hypothetical protein